MVGGLERRLFWIEVVLLVWVEAWVCRQRERDSHCSFWRFLETAWPACLWLWEVKPVSSHRSHKKIEDNIQIISLLTQLQYSTVS